MTDNPEIKSDHQCDECGCQVAQTDEPLWDGRVFCPNCIDAFGDSLIKEIGTIHRLEEHHTPGSVIGMIHTFIMYFFASLLMGVVLSTKIEQIFWVTGVFALGGMILLLMVFFVWRSYPATVIIKNGIVSVKYFGVAVERPLEQWKWCVTTARTSQYGVIESHQAVIVLVLKDGWRSRIASVGWTQEKLLAWHWVLSHSRMNNVGSP